MDNTQAAKKVFDEAPKDANAGVNAAHRYHLHLCN